MRVFLLSFLLFVLLAVPLSTRLMPAYAIADEYMLWLIIGTMVLALWMQVEAAWIMRDQGALKQLAEEQAEDQKKAAKNTLQISGK